MVSSALLSLASVLGLWTAASLLATPVLVVCMRSRARANARCADELRREAWANALRDG
jgi:hypothetical protein